MKRKLLCAVFIVLAGVAFCCAPDDDSSCKDDDSVQVLKSTDQPSMVYSLDQYDGVIYDGYGENSVQFNEQAKNVTTGSTLGYKTRGFFTFEIPPDVEAARSASLRIFVTDFRESCADSPGQDPHLYLFVKPWITQEKDYAKWQDCYYFWYGPNGPWYDPAGCEIVPHQLHQLPEFEMQHDDAMPNQGWYKLDSPRFLDFIKDLPYYQYGEKKYFSFEIEIQILGEIVPCTGHPVFNAYFEDGGNHGGTGNLPVLEISY